MKNSYKLNNLIAYGRLPLQVERTKYNVLKEIKAYYWPQHILFKQHDEPKTNGSTTALYCTTSVVSYPNR